jgi:bifunctional non-homologous end joining protein LigD
MAKNSTLEIEGRAVSVSNLDKVYYPKAGFTKDEVLNYYITIAPVLLPHLEGRPLTMKRYPNGVDAPFFYEKQCPKPRPAFVKTCKVARHHEAGEIEYCLVNNLHTLVWAANLGDLELHTSLSKAPQAHRPTEIVFDLDPGAPANAVQCAQVALWIREFFENLGLQTFVKSSGSKGMQLYVPLNTPTTYKETSPFAKAVAQTLEKAHPELVVSDMKKELRQGKVLVDWSQNSETKTTVCVYSLRAKERPFVSMPLEWDEVEKCLKKKDPTLVFFEAEAALKRVEMKGDIFAGTLTLKQNLKKALKVFSSAAPEAPRKPRLRGTGDGSISASGRSMAQIAGAHGKQCIRNRESTTQPGSKTARSSFRSRVAGLAKKVAARRRPKAGKST